MSFIIFCLETKQTDLNINLKMLDLRWCNASLRIFLNPTLMLNLAGWGNITYFLKWVTRFRAISFHWRSIPFLNLFPPPKSFITLCPHPTHYFKLNCTANYLAIIDNTIYQSIYKYVLVHASNLWHIIIHISTLLTLLQWEM